MASETADQLAARVVRGMLENDAASRALGVEVREVRAGRVQIAMKVRPDMINGHGTCHGGFISALADSAFAFCCNSTNELTVAAGFSIDFLAPGRSGELLIATATQLWRARRTGLYDVMVTREDGSPVATFRGRSHQLQGNVVPASP